MSRAADRHRPAAMLGLAGSVLGVVAGVVQATVGSRIPEWTGGRRHRLPWGS